MQVRELENPETSDMKRAEKSEESEEPESLEENSSKKDLSSESVIDVSGKVLDFPLLEGVESMVEGLYMYKNGLYLIPRAVGRLKGLKTLKFFANDVNLFPGEFKNLVEMETLQVKVAAPGVNGFELSKMRNLKELELSRVPPKPSAFPILSEIAGLKCLTRLSVCHFSIRYLPPEISCLNKLEFLDLSFNKMRNLPDEIASLSSLISLKVANNKLVELPPELSSLQRLENLDLSYNRLASLGFLELETMHNLQSLNLQHNDLRSCCQIPSWICCNLEGNNNYMSNDESAEMDVYQGVVQENDSNSSSITPRSHITGLSPNNRCLLARRTKGRKWQCNRQPRTRQERLNYSKKWKLEAAIQNSSEKCRACKMSVLGDNSLAEGSSALADADVDNKESFSGDDFYENSLINIENVDDANTKDSVVTCSCSALDTVGILKEVEGDCSDSGATLDSLSDAVKALDEGSSSETSNSIMKSKRHSEKDLDNPKPTKFRRPTNEPLYLSCQYSKISFCGVDDHLPDGFYDAGRDRPFMPLSSYEQNLQLHSREVILVDRERDEDLDSVLLCARALVYHFKQMNGSTDEQSHVAIDNLQIASLLALFVSDHLGGSDKFAALQKIRKAVSGSNYKKPFVCTCPTGTRDDTNIDTKQGVDNVEDIVFLDLCEKSLQSKKARLNSIIVPIGGLQFGVCRHRAVLMKYLCDRMEPRIPCELVRGYLDFSPHAWNVIVIKRSESWVRMIVDACHPHDIREETDPEYFCRMGKNHRTDPAWKYGKEIEKTGGDKKSYVYIECMFCKKIITGGVKRMKEHLACTHKNVAPCPGVPTDVKQEIAEYMNAGNMKRQLSQQQFEDMVELGSYYEKNDKEKDCSRGIRGPMDRFVSNIDDDDETHSKMNAAKMKEMRSSVCLDVGRFFFENAIPFNTVESPSFISMCRALGSYGRGFQPPTIYELRTWILKEEEESTRKIVEDVKKTWTTTGVSILSDGWSDMRNRSLINFLVNNPHGTVFLKSIDASDAIKDADLMFKLLDEVVEEVGEENVVQVVTDNASAYKAAGRKLMEKRKHLYWTPCAAHCIDLMLEKLGELPQHKHALIKAKKISNFIYNHQWVLALMRKIAKKEIVRPGATRFATAYLTLHRIYELKNSLRAMFTSNEWINSPWARKAEGKQVKGIILKDKNFWPSVAYALKTTNPLVSVLRLVDSEQMPAMGFIYGAMDNAKEQIAKNLGEDEAAYREIWNIIDEKWEFQLHRDLHAAAYYLNPRCQYADNFSRHSEVMAGLYNCMVRLISDPTERERADLQLDQFVEKQNFFGLEPAKLTFTKRSPVAWWTQFGVGTPELTKFATRVLSLTCSSSACERNWSTFNLVHTKRRNRLTTKRLNTLVYINYNKKLKDRHRRLKSLKEGEDPLILNDVPSDDEWIADHDIAVGVPSNTCDVNDDDPSLNFMIESSSRTQSQPIMKKTYSRKGKEKVTLQLVDEEDDFVEIESSEEENDGEIRYDDDSINTSNSDDSASDF